MLISELESWLARMRAERGDLEVKVASRSGDAPIKPWVVNDDPGPDYILIATVSEV